VANQHTIARDISFSGKALQTGGKTRVTCRPAPEGHGISFTRSDLAGGPSYRLGDEPPADPGKTAGRRSTVGGPAGVQTVEHFLAALWGLGIDNVAVEVEGPEMPAMDGSAKGFLDVLKEAGLKEQRAERKYIRIDKPLEVAEGESSITAMPGESLAVSYLIDYRVGCIGREVFEIELDGASFEREIAPARTFCMLREALPLLLFGFGRGANLSNTLVLTRRGPLGARFRFPSEPARHKILDLVGDLYMLGRPVLGRITARKSGHALNARLVRKIYDEYLKRGNR